MELDTRRSGRINDVLVLDDQILVADRTTDRVVAFDRDGAFLRTVERRGRGPGEFRTPTALLEDADGTILVSQLNNRLTRLTPDLELIDVYETDVSTFIADLAMLGTQVLLFDGSYRADGDNYILWDHGSGREGTFDPRNELSQVPYWNAAWSTHIAVGPRHVFVADNMAYPMRRYTLDKQFVDTVGTAPMSWSQARQPAFGEFATPRAARRTRMVAVIYGHRRPLRDRRRVADRDPPRRVNESPDTGSHTRRRPTRSAPLLPQESGRIFTHLP